MNLKSKNTNVTTSKIYRNCTINCSASKPCYLNILDDLYRLAFVDSASFIKPLGLHVRVRFNTSKMRPSNFSSRLKNFYAKRGDHAKVSVRETDTSGDHYHYALVIEGKHCTRGSLHHFLAKLQKNGFLLDYCIPSHEFSHYGIDLSYPRGCQIFFQWTSYLAKVKTKPAAGQKFSSSRPKSNNRKKKPAPFLIT